MKKDPVCNMYVDERDAVTAECDGVVYYFCSEGCRDKFLKEKTCKAPRASYDLAGKGGVYCGRAAAEFIKGEVMVNPDCSTSCPGIFAAGDVTNAFGKRIIIACGEGAKAAMAARQYVLALRKRKGPVEARGKL